MTRWRSLALGVVSAAIFACLAGYRLGAPGLYYDEVHQVPAAFAWLGAAPGHFCKGFVGGVPWLTMPYSGAVKSALFALFLHLSGAAFSVEAWRWFGIVLVLPGWIWCVAAVGRRWGLAAQLALAALLLTDSTVLLTTRHDWGPTALALSLRCAFVAVWVRADRLAAGSAFALGLIAGFAIFEKLSSIVLLAPLAIALIGVPRRQVGLAVIGLGLGALPLAIVNLSTWLAGQGLVSLAAMTDPRAGARWITVAQYLSLGQSQWVRHWVLDLPLHPAFVGGEIILMAATVVLGCMRRDSRRYMLAYAAIGAAILLLPRYTGAHHWIAGTPFQYVAIAILVARAEPARGPARALLALLLLLRLPLLAEDAAAIAANRTAPRFDPAPTRVARFLATRDDALVVTPTWGLANQIVAFAQGRRDAVYEPIYSDGEVDAFIAALASTDRSTLYVATTPSRGFVERTHRVLAAIADDSRWLEVPVDAEVEQTPLVRVRKLVRDHG